MKNEEHEEIMKKYKKQKMKKYIKYSIQSDVTSTMEENKEMMKNIQMMCEKEPCWIGGKSILRKEKPVQKPWQKRT